MFQFGNLYAKGNPNLFPFLTNLILITCLICAGIGENVHEECQLLSATDTAGKAALERLRPLYESTFDVTEYDTSGNERNFFRVKICSTADSSKQKSGAVQYQAKDYKNVLLVVGYINSTTASMKGNYIHLSYHGGDQKDLCNNTHRMAEIMFICDESTERSEMVLLEKYDEEHCFYLFEVGTHYACQVKDSLSGGSIFCILFFTGVGIYLLLGFLYQRLVVGAKGLEQIPNYTFWRDFGNLQADGCEFLCRCGPRQEAQSYRGIDERGPRDDERDDQLLNM